MAGNSSASVSISEPKEMVASCTPVTEQMKMLLTKAKQLKDEEAILGKLVVLQIKGLIEIGDRGTTKISDAEGVGNNASEELERWLEEVYDAISEASDLLDECEYHRRHRAAFRSVVPRRREDTKESKSEVRKYITSMSSSLVRPITSHVVRQISTCFQWSDTAKKFRSANSTLDRVLKGITGQTWAAEDLGRAERSAGSQATKDVVGIESKVLLEDNDLHEIVGELLYSENDKDLSFVCLVGWSATGKKALAQHVYKNEEVMFHYDERMWVQVTSNFDNTSIAKSILTALTRTRIEPLNQNKPEVECGKVYVDLGSSSRVQVSMEKVIDGRLKERLKGRRYLLVLDGVSEVQAPLKDFLEGLGGSKGCKVVTTVGKKPTGGSSVVYYHEHEMNLDSEKYCRKLFESISSPVPPVFDKCPGNAYYIKILASLMCRMKDESQRRINEASEKWKDPKQDIVKLCFDYMSSLPLKRCLQCCRFFPEGCLISREELLQLWMAQGYLNLPSGNASEMVDLGLLYYEILLKCGFLQVSEEDDFDKQSCKVHNVLWNVITFPGLKTVNKQNANAKYFSEAVHLLITCEVTFSKSLMSSFSKLRTLRLENCGGLGDFLDCAPGLRVLMVVDESIEELPDAIGKLIRLKYLDISRTKIERLPDTFSELYNLQTLRLYGLLHAPRNFDNLKSLRNVSIKNDILSSVTCKFPKGAKVWRANSSLKVFLNKDGNIDSWEWLKVPNTCSSISIHRLENATTDTVRDQTAGFAKKHGIEGLKLHWSARRENSYDEDLVLENLVPNGDMKSLAIENFQGTSFPSWMMNIGPSCVLHKVVKLELENCSWCQELPSLGHLHSLTILKIVGLDSVLLIAQEFYGTDATAFPKLKVFILSGMKNLKVWHGPAPDTKAFPVLMSLEVEECPKLTGIPNMNGMRLRKLRIAHTKMLTAPAGSIESLADLELFGLPALGAFSIGSASNLKSLKIGCFQGSLDDLSGQLENLRNLTNLTIWGYDQLIALPDWIANLHSLQVLKLQFCERLECLPSPERMQHLTSLRELNISNCPILEHRFIRESRPEWKKICCVSTIIVNNETIHPPHINNAKRAQVGEESGSPVATVSQEQTTP